MTPSIRNSILLLFMLSLSVAGSSSDDIIGSFFSITSAPSPINRNVTITPTGCGVETGSIEIEILSGSGDYSINFNGEINPMAGNLFDTTMLAQGLYNVTLIDNILGCSDSFTPIVSATAIPPDPDISPLSPTCTYEADLDGIVGTGTLQWSASGPGAVIFDNATIEDPHVTVTVGGEYTFYLEETEVDCSGVDSIKVAMGPPSTVSGGNDTTVCSQNYQMMGSTTTGSWNWVEATNQAIFSPSNTVADPVVNVPDYEVYTFFWTYTDVNSCTANGQVDIDFRLQPVAMSTDSLFFCQLLDNALEAIPASGGAMGMWDIPVGNFNYNPIEANSILQNNGTFGNFEAIWTVENSPFCIDSHTTHLIYSAPEQAEIQGFDLQTCGDTQAVSALNSNGTWSSPDPEISFDNPSSPNSNINTTAPGAYTFVWTVGSGDCATSDDRTILFHNPSEVTITTTTDQICSDGSIELNATSLNGTELLWTSSGDGDFSSTNTLNSEYTPGATDSISGTVTLTLTNLGNGTCPDVSDAITIEIVPAVAIFVPPFGNPVCSTSSISINANATNTSSVSWTSNGDGSFSPSNTDPLVVYSPGPTDGANGSVVLTLTGFPESLVCDIVSASTTITLIEPPYAGTDKEVEVCTSSPLLDMSSELDVNAEPGGTFLDVDGSGALSGSDFDPMIAGAGIYQIAYVVYGIFPCANDTIYITVEVSAEPNAGLDATGTACVQGASTNLSTFLSSDAEPGGSWAPHPGLSGSIFDQSTVGPGNYTFYYIVPGNSVCEADSASVQLSVTSGPSAGDDTSIIECATSTSIDLFNHIEGSPDVGGSWSDLTGSGGLSGGILDASIAGEGIFTFEYLVSLAGCPPAASILTIEILPVPTITITSFPTSICSVDVISLESESSDVFTLEWTSSGTGTFDNLDQAQTFYSPSQADIVAGTVDITVIGYGDPTCDQVSDTKTISIIQNPVSNAGLDASTCGLNYVFPAVPSIGSGIWNGPPGITYSTDPNAAFTVPGPDIYTFTWTENNLGCVDSDQVTIEFLSSPVITSSEIVCVNTNTEYIVVVQVELGDPSSYQFSQDGTLVGTEFTSDPFPTGSPYSIAVWDANQCDTFLLEGSFNCPVLTDPGSFDTSPLSYCEGDLINAPFNDDEFLDANDALVFLLHDETPGIGIILGTSTSPQFSFLPGMQTDVTYYVSSAAGDDIGGGTVDLEGPNTLFSEPVPITFYSTPTATITTTEPGFCLGDSTLIEVSFTGAPSFELDYLIGGELYQPEFESETGSFYVSDAGLLTFESLTDANCSTALNSSVDVLSYNLPIASMTDSVYFCSDEIGAIEVSLEGVGPWGYSIFYEGALYEEQLSEDALDSFIPESSGTYSITELSDFNCPNPESIDIEVIINPSPQVDAGPDILICANEVASIGGTEQTSTNYQWSNPISLESPDSSATAVILPPMTSEVMTLYYILTAEFVGCMSTDSVLLTINPLPQDFGIAGEMDVCAGESTLIEAYGGMTYVWAEDESLADPESASTLISPLEDSEYFVNISNEYGCSVSDSIFITVHELPDPLSSGVVIDPCPPAQVMWINETIGDLTTCEWSFTEGSIESEDCSMSVVDYSLSGLYSGSLSVTTIHGCTNTASTDTVEVFSGLAEFSFSPSTLSIDDSLLHVFDISQDAASQFWTLNGDSAGTGPIAALALEGLRPDYYEVCLYMTTSQGCTDTTCHVFELDNPVAVFVPNTFTPDGDGLNDEFGTVINGEEYLRYYELSVYDRRGHVQFYSRDPKETWDAINERDNTIAQGLYEWVLEIDVFGEPRPRRYIGTITVLK